MSDETPHTRAPDLAAQLHAFNEMRARILGEKPISSEGERALGRLLSDPMEDADES